jgi:hypothetical protein
MRVEDSGTFRGSRSVEERGEVVKVVAPAECGDSGSRSSGRMEEVRGKVGEEGG